MFNVNFKIYFIEMPCLFHFLSYYDSIIKISFFKNHSKMHDQFISFSLIITPLFLKSMLTLMNADNYWIVKIIKICWDNLKLIFINAHLKKLNNYYMCWYWHWWRKKSSFLDLYKKVDLFTVLGSEIIHFT